MSIICSQILCTYSAEWFQYKYQNKAIDLAKKITKVCLLDIEKTGGMHENYNAETGEPLAAPNFISWNLLVANMLKESTTNTNPFRLNK